MSAETTESLAAELAGLARYHATHAGVSKGDRARIAELCDLLDGADERRNERIDEMTRRLDQNSGGAER